MLVTLVLESLSPSSFLFSTEDRVSCNPPPPPKKKENSLFVFKIRILCGPNLNVVVILNITIKY